jgi:hypothetical protein
LLYQLLLIAGAVLGFRACRDLWFLALVTTAILAACIPARPNGQYITTRGQRWLIGLGVLGALLAVVSLRGISNVSLQKQVALELPANAAEFISHHELPGPLFNDFTWGGYFIWKLPSLSVSMDGRANVHGDRRIGRSVETWAGKHDWPSDPDLSSARLVIGPIDAPLTAILRLAPDYQVAYEDQVAVVFVRRAPSASPHIAHARVEHDQSAHP